MDGDGNELLFETVAPFFQRIWGVLKTLRIIIVVFIVIYKIFDLVIHRRAD